jgi:S-DNA-T family DNA segregation ATPase FtsK/SpoIIIE
LKKSAVDQDVSLDQPLADAALEPEEVQPRLDLTEGNSLNEEANRFQPPPVVDPLMGPLNIIAEPISEPAPAIINTLAHPPDEVNKESNVEELPLEIKPTAEDQTDVVKTAASVLASPKFDPIADLKGYKYPSLDLLAQHSGEKIVMDQHELEANKSQIMKTLQDYDIEIQKIFATVGPTVTLYEIIPAAGVRISRIKNLEDDIALSLSALGIRIIAPIPGKGTIGIEVPNVKKSIVGMRSLLGSEKFQKNDFALPIALGKKIDNENFIVDLAAMPHLLMAGATGQGKSVGLNAILVSLLYKKHPSQLKFVLVDPKKVELSLYRIIEKHFLAKLPGEEDAIITDTRKVVNTLNALCIEMDERYDLLKDAGCRNIREYNEKFVGRRLNPEKGHKFLPFIVLVIDEFADLIMTAGKEIETPIARLAQLARAIGIHLIVATQRPSVNIITGTIKANFPARIAFKVSSKVDSRTILDVGGAEQLIGRGDMLVSYQGEVTRVQCVFVDTPEVEKVVEFVGEQKGYPSAFELPEVIDEKDSEDRELDLLSKDPLFNEAASLIVQSQMGSTSLIQRRLKLGYNRAGRLMDQLEAAGIVGPSKGSKVREVLFKTEYELEQFLKSME